MIYLLLLVASAAVATPHHTREHSHGSESVAEKDGPLRAIAKLAEHRGDKVHGNITFTQLPDGNVHIQGVLVGMAPGHYGFHIYEKGDITGGCGSAGGHFNPDNNEHGHPDDANRHAGDLGNVVFDENHVSKVDIVDKVIKLSGPYSVIGRAIVLHEGKDDYGQTGHPDSKKTGNTGAHVACGVIGYL